MIDTLKQHSLTPTLCKFLSFEICSLLPSSYTLLYPLDLTFFSLKFQFHSLWINSRKENSHETLEHSVIVKNMFYLLIVFMCVWGERASELLFKRRGIPPPQSKHSVMDIKFLLITPPHFKLAFVEALWPW